MYTCQCSECLRCESYACRSKTSISHQFTPIWTNFSCLAGALQIVDLNPLKFSSKLPQKWRKCHFRETRFQNLQGSRTSLEAHAFQPLTPPEQFCKNLMPWNQKMLAGIIMYSSSWFRGNIGIFTSNNVGVHCSGQACIYFTTHNHLPRTVRVALAVVFPNELLATHLYNPASLFFRLWIFSVPLRKISNLPDVLMALSWGSVQETVGCGLPTVAQSNDADCPSGDDIPNGGCVISALPVGIKTWESRIQ